MWAVLFTQLATAAYACPMNRSGTDAPAAMAGLPCAEMLGSGVVLDPEQPGLCLQHCQFGNTQQPADAPPSLQAPSVAPPMLFVVVPAPLADVDAARWLQRQRVRERSPALALSIAHCCYRI